MRVETADLSDTICWTTPARVTNGSPNSRRCMTTRPKQSDWPPGESRRRRRLRLRPQESGLRTPSARTAGAELRHSQLQVASHLSAAPGSDPWGGADAGWQARCFDASRVAQPYPQTFD